MAETNNGVALDVSDISEACGLTHPLPGSHEDVWEISVKCEV